MPSSVLRLPFAALLLIATQVASLAAEGDTVIRVQTTSYSVRVRPSPIQGNATWTYNISLQGGRKITEAINTSGTRPLNASNIRELGGSEKNVSYRVVDASTIQRIYNAPTHVSTITIKVDGKSCTASVNYELKPGQKEYQTYSVTLGTLAFYSELRPVNTTCTIQ